MFLLRGEYIVLGNELSNSLFSEPRKTNELPTFTYQRPSWFRISNVYLPSITHACSSALVNRLSLKHGTGNGGTGLGDWGTGIGIL